MPTNRHQPIKRDDQFVSKIATKITKETPSKQNPFIADHASWFGYQHEDLLSNCSFTEVMCLFFYGELPPDDLRHAFEKTLLVLMNPGPRHESIRATTTAAVSKTLVPHWLPIGLEILASEDNGAFEVMQAHRFIKQSLSDTPKNTLKNCEVQQYRIAPGFGCLYGTAELIPLKLAHELKLHFSQCQALDWVIQFSQRLSDTDFSLLMPGLAAAACIDLNLDSRQAVGLYQIAAVNGIFAHAYEMSHQPTTAIPWITDSNYIIEDHEQI